MTEITTPQEPRAYTAEEVRERFLRNVLFTVNYWETLPARDVPEGESETYWRLHGLAFSILAMLDGVEPGLPAFMVIPETHPSDRAAAIAEGENFYPGPEDGICDIGGDLHGEFALMKNEQKKV